MCMILPEARMPLNFSLIIVQLPSQSAQLLNLVNTSFSSFSLDDVQLTFQNSHV